MSSLFLLHLIPSFEPKAASVVGTNGAQKAVRIREFNRAERAHQFEIHPVEAEAQQRTSPDVHCPLFMAALRILATR
jgi:transcription initiation factor TFIID subunit TAF12